MAKMKKEGSVVSNIKGFSAPFGSTVKRTRGKKKSNPSKPYGEGAIFENVIAMALLDEDGFVEVVRKRGNVWVLHDDETDAEVGVFKDREKAWERQRRVRSQKAREKQSKKKERERQVQALTPTLAPGAVKPPAPVKAGKPRVAKAKPKVQPRVAKKPQRHSGSRRYKAEDIIKLAKSLISENKKVLKEKSMISYVFENTPVSDESATWEQFVGKLSKETVMSDSKLKGILKKMAKVEAQMLGRSVDAIGGVLGEAGVFDVQRKNVDQDPESGDVRLNFAVKVKESNKTLPFAVKLEHGKPLIMFPEESRNAINEDGGQELKLLRAELMHIQETVLDQMEDVINVSAKRDSYLKGLEDKVDKFLGNMGSLEISMIKYLIKNKYRGVR